MLLLSCEKISEIENPDESIGQPCEITASFEETRTSIDEGWKTSWDNNDVMTVYYTRSGYNKHGYANFEYKGEGIFEGSLDSPAGTPNWIAVYPKTGDADGKTTGSLKPTITHSASQTMTRTSNAHIAADNDPVFGYVLGNSDPAFVMHHTASVLDFNIKNGAESPITVTKIEFTAPNNIAGQYSATIDDLSKANEKTFENLSWTGGSSKTVTLTVEEEEEGEEIAKEGSAHFYAAIHPLSADEASGSYTIKVTATMGGKTVTSTKTISAALTFTAGTKKPVNFTFVPDAKKEKRYVKVTSDPTDWTGTYIIVDENAEKAFDENATNYAADVTITDGEIEWSETVAKYEVTITSAGTDKYDIKTVSGQYMLSFNYGKETLYNSNERNGYTYYNTLAISSGNVTMISTRGGTGSKNYFGYVSNTSENPNGKNFGHLENATTRTVQLYKLENGDVPPTPPTEKSYAKVTTKPDDWSGTYLIVDENSKNAFAYDQTGYKTSVTITNSTIAWSEDIAKYEVTISVASGSDKTHYNVKTSNERYLYRSSSDTDSFLNSSNTYSGRTYYAKIAEEGMVSLVTKYSGGTEYFFRYSSNAFGFSTSTSNTIQLYKLQQ